MGLVEELGELGEARQKADNVLVLDSIADIGIYFCDYWHRYYRGLADVSLDSFSGALRSWDPDEGLVQRRLGRLYQVHLKRFQRIRGMDDDNQFDAALLEAQKGFFCCLEEFCDSKCGRSLYDLVSGVFQQQVAKRNWKANSKDGSSAASVD